MNSGLSTSRRDFLWQLGGGLKRWRVARAIVPIELTEQLDQRVLGAVLGGAAIAEQARRVADEDRPQRVKQRRDRRAVAVSGGRHPAVELGPVDHGRLAALPIMSTTTGAPRRNIPARRP
jgi:hypothetical protein